MPRTTIPQLAAIGAFSFAITFAMSTLEPGLIGHQVLALAPTRANTALGLITAAGLAVAMVTQPWIGAWSDRTRTRLGSRLPFLIAGVALEIFCLLLIAFAPTLWLLVAGVLAVQFASNTIQAPWQALFPDHVPEDQRGQAAAIRAVLEIVAGVVGRLVAGELLGRLPSWGRPALAATACAPGVVLLVCLLVTAAFVPRTNAVTALGPSSAPAPAPVSPGAWWSQPGFVRWCLNRFLFWNGFIGVTTFLLTFAIGVVGLAEADAQRFIGKLSAVIGAVLLVSLVPIGIMGDRVGRRPLVVAAGLLAAAGTTLLLVTRSPLVIGLAGAIVGLGISMYLSADWAMITDIVPAESAARYLGIANVATAGGSAVARLAGGALIDAINAWMHSRSAGYLAVYALAAAAFVLSSVVALELPGAAPARRPAVPTEGSASSE